MRLRYLLAAFILCAGSTAQAQFVDDFSDGDLTANPAWSGDDAVFIINAAQQLQLNNTVAGTSQLRSANAMGTLNDMEWRVRVKQTFSGSGSNFGRVYLVSDQADLTGPLNGYYLQFGEAGSNDAIELFAQTGSVSTSVCRGAEAQIANSFDVGVQVKRDVAGSWQLFVDVTGGTNYALQASGTNATHNTSAFIGVRCTYTASNANKFFYDDFYAGPVIVDNTPPTILSASAAGAADVTVLFSEPVEEMSAETVGNYGLSSGIAISSAIRNGIDASIVHLSLALPLTNGTEYTVTANGVEDLAGNASSGTSATFTYVVPEVPQPGDVVINEIMADPSPVVQLPEAEFLELFNATTDKFLDLAGWQLSTASTQATLPAVVLGPGEYVVLVNNGQLANFAGLPNVMGWSLSNTALLNGGTTLTLSAPGSVVIDQVTYSSTWYGDDVKDDGGWTLERINPFAPCSDASNWTASNDERGGTPGAQNSVFDDTPDTDAPVMQAVQVVSATEIVLVFNEGLDVAGVTSAEITIAPVLDIASIVPAGAAFDRIRLLLDTPMQEGVVHTITVEGVADCSGNLIEPSTGSFALPEAIAPLDIVINEVLYDPIGNGSDFVELYNRSAKVLSLGGLQLANESNGVIGNFRVITADPVILMPGAYILLATNTTDIATRYPQSHTDRFLQMSLPGYNNGSGTVVLADAANNTLDLFRYNDDLHFTLLNKTEGTSLERVDPDRPTDDNTNWHSAAQDIGKATPGFQNSQYAPAPEARGEMTIDPAIFSPDNDGHQDLLTIAYRFDQPGFVATLKLYDVAGREVRTLWNNELLGTTGAVSWDGIMDSGSKARMGPYIVLMEAYDLSGNVEKYRKTVTLAHRLD
ncbi:MAG: lamin tail domain-containing protein [Flavobacteriales bacterium]|nr:lamin tail domain-containing protein [Flavobacteriales bacterium]